MFPCLIKLRYTAREPSVQRCRRHRRLDLWRRLHSGPASASLDAIFPGFLDGQLLNDEVAAVVPETA